MWNVCLLSLCLLLSCGSRLTFALTPNEFRYRHLAKLDNVLRPFQLMGPSVTTSVRRRIGESPVYYIRLPPHPYFYKPGYGFSPTAAPDPFQVLPVSFNSNGKPSGIYQWKYQSFGTQPLNGGVGGGGGGGGMSINSISNGNGNGGLTKYPIVAAKPSAAYDPPAPSPQFIGSTAHHQHLLNQIANRPTVVEAPLPSSASSTTIDLIPPPNNNWSGIQHHPQSHHDTANNVYNPNSNNIYDGSNEAYNNHNHHHGSNGFGGSNNGFGGSNVGVSSNAIGGGGGNGGNSFLHHIKPVPNPNKYHPAKKPTYTLPDKYQYNGKPNSVYVLSKPQMWYRNVY